MNILALKEVTVPRYCGSDSPLFSNEPSADYTQCYNSSKPIEGTEETSYIVLTVKMSRRLNSIRLDRLDSHIRP